MKVICPTQGLRWFSFLFAGMLFYYPSIAQPDTVARYAQLQVLARSYGDSIVLRWAPTTAGAWRLANRYGYRILRQRLTQDSREPLTTPEELTTQPLKPWSLEEWKTRFANQPQRYTAAIAAQVLYGRRSVQSPTTLQNWASMLKHAAQELENRYSFALFVADLDPAVADGLALRFVDHQIQRGQTYLYTITTNVPDSLYRILPATITVDAIPDPPLMPPSELRALEGDGQITLEWKNWQQFTAFFVERSEDGITYHRLTERPLLRTTLPDDTTLNIHWIYHDTTVQNYRNYHYRVIGISPFGELSPPAEVTGMARDLTPPAPPQLSEPQRIGDHHVQLQWQWSDPVADLKGFIIYRSAQSHTGYALLHPEPLPPDTRRYVDSAATEVEPYYIVSAVDTAGNEAFSLPYRVLWIDTIPPAPPTGLRGTIDSNGIVQLQWKLGNESDLLGYRVLWANDTTHEFSQATNKILFDTTFIDTVSLQTLSDAIYYRVVAVDFRHNHSQPSPTLTLHRPDLHPPVPPVLHTVVESGGAILLQWIPSSSIDVAYQIVERRTEHRQQWKALISLSPQDSMFLDQAVAGDTVYYYRIVAVDRNGHRTPSSISGATSLPLPSTLDSIPFFDARYDPDTRRVHLRWEYPYQPNQPIWFVIYRGYLDRPLEPYKAVAGNERSLIDTDFPGTGIYRYAIQARSQLFGASPLSEIVMIIVPDKP